MQSTSSSPASTAPTTGTGTVPPVLLRPHHLLCLQNFRGKGYSPGFVRRMTEIHTLVFAKAAASDENGNGPDPTGLSGPAPILLVDGRDDLCGSCPNCGDRDCTFANPARFDALVLSRSGLTVGQVLPEGMDSPGIPSMSPELLEACCPGCTWLETCRKICSR